MLLRRYNEEIEKKKVEEIKKVVKVEPKKHGGK